MATAQTASTGRARFVTRHTSSTSMRCHYDEVRQLGEGNFGRVSLVRERITRQDRVCKVVSLVGLDAHELQLARTEIQLLCDLDHPRINRLYEYAEDFVRKEIVLVLEYLPGGDCLNLIKNGARPAEALVSRIVSQTLIALGHCHERGIVHRDVKLENIMLASRPTAAGADCRLIDFGLGERCHHPSYEVVGTPQYMAPEVIQGRVYSPAADIWSVGICAFELLAGFTPFGTASEYGGRFEPVMQRIGSFRDLDDVADALARSSLWESRSEDAKDFVRLLLSVDQGRRPSVAQALEHPWLETYQGYTEGLSANLLESLAGFMRAPPIVQSCLFAIAARKDVPEIKQLGDVFLGMDLTGDGQVSFDEFSDALDSAGHWWAPNIDVIRLFEAMDLDDSGTLSFTKFIAACLHANFNSMEDLLMTAFEALDEARRGTLSVDSVRRLFPKGSSPMLGRLPQHQWFGADEWVTLLVASCNSKAVRTPQRQCAAPAGLLASFSCVAPACSKDDTELSFNEEMFDPIDGYSYPEAMGKSCYDDFGDDDDTYFYATPRE